MTAARSLAADLNAAGVPVTDLWELVNSTVDYPDSIPVLLDWLRNLESRAVSDERPKLREGIVRALSVPFAGPIAAHQLIAEFRTAHDPTGLGIRWVIGNALSVIADLSSFDELSDIATESKFGRSRQMLVLFFGRSEVSRATPLLVRLLSDDDVAAHALIALRQLRPVGVRREVEAMLDHPAPLVRREARTTLAKLPT